jgi:hypothetical protein
MSKRFKNKDTSSTSELNKAYYNIMMADAESPNPFVVKMERACKKLKDDASEDIEDKQFH